MNDTLSWNAWMEIVCQYLEDGWDAAERMAMEFLGLRTHPFEVPFKGVLGGEG